MSDPAQPLQNASTPATPVRPEKPRNPALRMLGLPRFRLPSRNWLIFLSITGSFSTAVWYDRREKRRTQQRWCNAVSHLSKEILPVEALQRKVTVFLAAPPNDGLRSAREHFHEYVKPILVAAAIDWDVVEGRREGEVRAGLAEKIRKRRRKQGEPSTTPMEPDPVEETQQRMGVRQLDEQGGDLILGRHTWKEYLRGLHEGWLGPLDPVPEATPQPDSLSGNSGSAETKQPVAGEDTSVASEGSESDTPKVEEPKPKPFPTPPYIRPQDYHNVTNPHIPSILAASTALPFPHLLGFLNTPVRIMRYLNQRKLADETGRAVAAMILADSPQPYEHQAEWEQKNVLEYEESDWHKSARAPNPAGEEDKERPWQEAIMIDERVGSRMRKLSSALEAPSVETSERSPEWSGGAASEEKIGWGRWWLEAFDMYIPEPDCKGWEHGLQGDEDA